jgi:hypothetical protein
MTDHVDGLRTTEALKYAGLGRTFWNSIVTRQLYTDVPIARPGRIGRLFSVDDLIALGILGELLRIGVHLHVAAHTASNLRACLRADPSVQTLHLVTGKNASGVTQPAVVRTPSTDAVVQWVLDIAKARASAQQEIAKQKAARQ